MEANRHGSRQRRAPCVIGVLAQAQAEQPNKQHQCISGQEDGGPLADHVAHEVRIPPPPSGHRADIGPGDRLEAPGHFAVLPGNWIRRGSKYSAALLTLSWLIACAGSTLFGQTSEQ